jgi:phospholipid/cholesterol/gamma-HCH transport system ATP-binding protein
MAPVISARGIVNRFGTQVVHNGVDLDVYPGEVFGIVGGSGSGKSVLLRTLLGLQRPRAGEVWIDGRTVVAEGDPAATAPREVKRRYGVTFQHGALFSSLTVRQNIEVPMIEHLGLSPAARRRLARHRDGCRAVRRHRGARHQQHEHRIGAQRAGAAAARHGGVTMAARAAAAHAMPGMGHAAPAHTHVGLDTRGPQGS